MENRFGFKDLVQIVLLIAIMISVWLAMGQFDRQWDDVQEIQARVAELATVQSETRNQLEDLRAKLDSASSSIQIIPNDQAHGDPTNDDPKHTGSPETDPFARIRKARSMPEFADGGQVVDAFGTRIKSVTALTYEDAYGRRIQDYVLESLATRDPDTLEFGPFIAESWEIEDNTDDWRAFMKAKKAALEVQLSEDPDVYDPILQEMLNSAAQDGERPAEGDPAYERLAARAKQVWMDQEIEADEDLPAAMVIRFNIRKGVTFSDGKPLTAHDVQFTWELLNNPRVDAPATRNFYDNVISYKALDDYVVEFRLREPHYLGFSMVASFVILPKHFYEKIAIDDLNRKPGLLMGSGPYRLPTPTDWTPGQLMELVRNENYWGPKSGPNKLIWQEIEDDVARLTAFKNGDIDLFSATPEQYEDLLENKATLERTNPYEYQGVPTGYSFIAWNLERKNQPTIFADKRVRQAMTFLINRQRIAEEVLLGYAVPTAGPFDPSTRQSDPAIKPRQYDPAQALALLKEAGWTRSSDGTLVNAQGEPFRFTLTYPSGSDVYERTMLFLKDSFAENGIIMQQDPQEWSVFIERLNGRAFESCALAWGGGAIESDIRQMFHSSQIADGANNFTNYRNAELDRLIDEARQTIDEDERMKLWQACHRILYEDQPYTFMHRRKTLRFVDKRYRNIEFVTTGMNDRTEWFVPAALQQR